MSTEVREDVGGQEPVAQPLMDCVSPEERLLLRFYRQLGEAERLFMRRAMQAMVPGALPG